LKKLFSNNIWLQEHLCLDTVQEVHLLDSNIQNRHWVALKWCTSTGSSSYYAHGQN